jgi:cysteine desulfurase
MSGKPVFYLKLTADGYIDDASFYAAIATCKDKNLRPFLSVMKVNNETGRIKDLSTYSQIIRQMNGLVHSDAVQAFGKIDFSDWTYQTDMITLSAHKVGGAKGAGILIIKDNIPIVPLMSGGGQEMGHRAGTQNVPAIMALGAFMNCVTEAIAHTKNCKIWRDKIIKTIKNHNPDAVIICDDDDVIHNTLYVITPQISSQNQVIRADLDGIYISSGSACSSGKVKSSHVITSYGYDDHLSASGIRISMGFNTTDTDIQRFCDFYTGLKL